jgi:hypothetical protein
MPKPEQLDKLNQLEKLGYKEGVNSWMYLRKMRNQLMYDYPDDYDPIISPLSMPSLKVKELLIFLGWVKKQNTSISFYVVIGGIFI